MLELKTGFFVVIFKVFLFTCLCARLCVSEYVHMSTGVHGDKKRCQKSRRYRKLWVTWHGCWELLSRPWQEQQALQLLSHLSRPRVLLLMLLLFSGDRLLLSSDWSWTCYIAKGCWVALMVRGCSLLWPGSSFQRSATGGTLFPVRLPALYLPYLENVSRPRGLSLSESCL